MTAAKFDKAWLEIFLWQTGIVWFTVSWERQESRQNESLLSYLLTYLHTHCRDYLKRLKCFFGNMTMSKLQIRLGTVIYLRWKCNLMNQLCMQWGLLNNSFRCIFYFISSTCFINKTTSFSRRKACTEQDCAVFFIPRVVVPVRRCRIIGKQGRPFLAFWLDYKAGKIFAPRLVDAEVLIK